MTKEQLEIAKYYALSISGLLQNFFEEDDQRAWRDLNRLKKRLPDDLTLNKDDVVEIISSFEDAYRKITLVPQTQEAAKLMKEAEKEYSAMIRFFRDLEKEFFEAHNCRLYFAIRYVIAWGRNDEKIAAYRKIINYTGRIPSPCWECWERHDCSSTEIWLSGCNYNPILEIYESIKKRKQED